MNYNSTPKKDCNKTRRYDEFVAENNMIEPAGHMQITPTAPNKDPKTPDNTLFLDMTSEEDDDFSCLYPRQTTLSSDDCSRNRALMTQSIRDMDAYWARFRLPRKEWLQKEWNRGSGDRATTSNANNLVKNVNKRGKVTDNAYHTNANIYKSIDNITVNSDNTIVDNIHNCDDSSSVNSSTSELGMPSLYPTSTTLENKLNQKRKDFMQKYSFSPATDKKQKICEESTESEVCKKNEC